MVEDTRQPEFKDYSECDDCGATFWNDDLNILPGDEWVCDDCLEERNNQTIEEA
jgi:formylmethanofuran dehydrogenase subunit E